MGQNGRGALVFTIGYQGIDIDQFLKKLGDNSIHVLIDVRKNPISRKKYFSKTKLSQKMHDAGIEYYHTPDLGIPSERRKNLDVRDPRTYAELFDFYDEKIIPNAEASLRLIKTLAKEKKRIALTCFEADFHYCHRHRITDALTQDKAFKNAIRHL